MTARFVVGLRGCDASIYFIADLTEAEANAIDKVASMADDRGKDVTCAPTLYISPEQYAEAYALEQALDERDEDES